MNLELKKCGDLYVYFDENKNPLYAFEVDYNSIKRFYLMCDNMPDEIILPNIKIEDKDYYKISNSSMLEAIKIKNEKREVYGIEGRLERYAVGAYKVARDCFRGIKKLKIIAPADYAIMLDWGCFDDNSEVEIVLPKNMTLKQVYRCFDTGFEYQRENWTLISHKDFNYESESYCGISVRDFKHEDARYYKITASEQRSASGGM